MSTMRNAGRPVVVAGAVTPSARSAPRWLARLALVVAAAAVVVLLAAAGLRASIGLLLVGGLGMSVALVAVWWFLTHRGVFRWLAAAVALAAPVVVAVMFIRAGPAAVDVAELARRAVRDGADLLGVAGGDGTQALVAAVAAESGTPFMVISAGTRNHFAMDLGLDREDPSTCLDALTDGVELHIDLGLIGDRTFVNNASFGAYAAVVQSPAYRDDKTATTLDMLPDLLVGHRGPRLELRTGNVVVSGPQAVLVSNNPYAAGDIAGLGRRERIDTGVLGVLAVTVGGAADAARLMRGRRSKVVTLVTVPEVTIDADASEIPVGIDGEAVTMPTPVPCTVRPGALRVRVPRQRPGIRAARADLDWTELRHLAVSGRRPAG